MPSLADGGVWVVVPYKGPAGSKSRLSALLDESERARLSLAMLDGVLDAALGARRVARVLVMLPEHAPAPERHESRLEFVSETPSSDDTPDDGSTTDGLNRVIIQAQAVAQSAGASRLLILPSDLPLVAADDIEALITAAQLSPIVISPDRASEGTNALLLGPPIAIHPSFGVGSFERHQRLAAHAGLSAGVIRRWGLALDLDTPADVLRLLAIDQECRAARLLHDLEILSRLAGIGLVQSAPSGV